METTPNPKSMKFVPDDREVLGDGAKAKVFKDVFEARSSPLASALLSQEGVREVMLAPQHVTVTKATLADWDDLQAPVEQELTKFFESGQLPLGAGEIERIGGQGFAEGSLEARIV